jgi:hypothetical protein
MERAPDGLRFSAGEHGRWAGRRFRRALARPGRANKCVCHLAHHVLTIRCAEVDAEHEAMKGGINNSFDQSLALSMNHTPYKHTRVTNVNTNKGE